MFIPAPEPKTELGRYRVLSRTAGVRVSPLQLGAMSIGDAWSSSMGSLGKEQAFELLDAVPLSPILAGHSVARGGASGRLGDFDVQF